MIKQLTEFLDVLRLNENPMGLFYTDQPPESGASPRRMTSLDQLTREGDHGVSWSSCLLSKIRYARRKNCPAFFDREHYGCLGGAFFMGFKSYYEPFEPALISTGIPGQIEGERYLDSTNTGKQFYDMFKPPEASGKVLVIQPLDQFTARQTPEIVLLFPSRDSLIGLNALTVFITRNPSAVQVPFGMGCAALVAWPRRFRRNGEEIAVIGGFDINCIKYFKAQELTYAVSYDFFLKMLDAWPKSILGTRAWQRLKKNDE
jgi:hypothetical protein